MRVDDGHRWVGADVSRSPAEDFEQRYEAKLIALVAELENNRRTVPGVPTPPIAMQMQMAYLHRFAEAAQRQQAHRDRWAQHLGGYHNPRVRGSRAVDVPQHIHWAPAAGIHWVNPPQVRVGLGEMLRSIATRLRGLGRPAPAEPVNQREETLRRVREGRNAGPQNQARAPRRIDPRRDR